MKVGAFSVSLAVKDIEVSKQFYQNLGFEVFGGNQEQNWLMMRNAEHIIGLFQGMFDSNILTFNPGWDQNAQNIEDFDDIREIKQKLLDSGASLTHDGVNSDEGPGSVMLKDPDGNMIMFDQHR